MKKLCFALAAIVMAIGSQAAQVKWSTSTVLYTGNATDTFNGTVYLVDSSAANGGIGSYTYAVYYNKASSSVWTTGQNYSKRCIQY